MNENTNELTKYDLIAFVTRRAGRLTPREVCQLIAELPDAREQFARLQDTPYSHGERQLEFLAEVVEKTWTQAYLDLPYAAAIEAAFALVYFLRETDLIPDSLGTLGLVDDIVVIQTVLARHAEEFERFRAAMGLAPVEFHASSPAT